MKAKTNGKLFLDLNRNLLKLNNRICLHGVKYQQECDKYSLRAPNHEMYLQEVRKSTLSPFDDKR